MIAHGSGDPERLAAAMRGVVTRLEPGLGVSQPALARTLGLGIADRRLQASLFLLFGVVAVLRRCRRHLRGQGPLVIKSVRT